MYDLETECGIFGAGIGEITLKNTDSLFISLNEEYVKKQYVGQDNKTIWP